MVGMDRLLLLFLLVLSYGNMAYGVGDLQRDRLSPEYRRQMYVGITTFSRFCVKRGNSVSLLARDAEEINQMLIRFIQSQHNARQCLWISKAAVLGVQTVHRTTLDSSSFQTVTPSYS